MPGKRRAAYINRGQRSVHKDAPKDAVKAAFGTRLQDAANRKGWNQSELARQAQLHMPKGKRLARDNVSTYIRGKVLPGPMQLKALADALGMKVDDLLPSRGVPSAADKSPPLDYRDLGDGNVWLRINQALPRKLALRIMNLLAGEDDNDEMPHRSKQGNPNNNNHDGSGHQQGST
jgi:transcriptional regulator with XRE-family HTH domain